MVSQNLQDVSKARGGVNGLVVSSSLAFLFFNSPRSSSQIDSSTPNPSTPLVYNNGVKRSKANEVPTNSIRRPGELSGENQTGSPVPTTVIGNTGRPPNNVLQTPSETLPTFDSPPDDSENDSNDCLGEGAYRRGMKRYGLELTPDWRDFLEAYRTTNQGELKVGLVELLMPVLRRTPGGVVIAIMNTISVEFIGTHTSEVYGTTFMYELSDLENGGSTTIATTNSFYELDPNINWNFIGYPIGHDQSEDSALVGSFMPN